MLITDKLTQTRNGGTPAVATVSSARSAAGTSLACDDLDNWPNDTVHYITYRKTAAGTIDYDTLQTFKGIVSGNTIGSVTLTHSPTDSDLGNDIGDYVEMAPTDSWSQDLYEAMTEEHDVNGKHVLSADFRKTIMDAIIPVATRGEYYGTKATFNTDPAGVGWMFPEEGVEYLRTDYPRLYAHFAIVDTSFIVSADKFKFPEKWFGTSAVSRKPSDTDFDTLGKSAGAKTHEHGLNNGYAMISPSAVSGSSNLHYRMRGTPSWSSSNRTTFNQTTEGNATSIPRGTDLGGTTDGGSTLQPSLTVNFIIKT